MDIYKHLLIGLPSTGKTTFLAALWHIVDSEEVDGSLIIKELHGNREYLNKIRTDWLRCQPLSRTLPMDEQTVSMRLFRPESKIKAEIIIPDLSGETYKMQWEKREWTRKYFEFAKEIVGTLLFVHPEHTIEPTRIDEADKLVREISSNQTETTSAVEEHEEWNPNQSPTQVQIVDLLQFLSFSKETSLPSRIGVIVSAWDLIQDEGKSPDEWLSVRLPLLHQYILSNWARSSYRIFGVSAQGGELVKDAEHLLRFTRHSERIIIEAQGANPHDLTAPVAWLLG